MKYRLIDDPLCDLNEDIPCYENCEDCPYFWDCMEEDEEEESVRIEKREMIYLSQKGADTWAKFSQILEALEKESENPDIKDLVLETKSCLNALWDGIEGIE